MRRIIYGLLIIVAIAFSVMAALSGPLPEVTETGPEPIPPIDELIPQGTRADREATIQVLCGKEIREMSMERYLIGVVAAEMPATFELEALMAQAVAARTNALYNMKVKQKTSHPGADVCSDFSCCTAYTEDEQLRDNWQDDYVDNITRIINAVLKTDGEYISYEGKPILAVFHSSSAGKTESSGNVWMTDLPYLQSVSSPETSAQVPNYVSTVTVSRSDFVDTLRKEYSVVFSNENAKSWITDISTANGRVSELNVCGTPIPGTALRSMFDLRSTAFAIELVDGDIVFTTVGNGHGVGMSQYGANAMAKDGIGYREILSAYYKGTTIEKD